MRSQKGYCSKPIRFCRSCSRRARPAGLFSPVSHTYLKRRSSGHGTEKPNRLSPAGALSSHPLLRAQMPVLRFLLGGAASIARSIPLCPAAADGGIRPHLRRLSARHPLYRRGNAVAALPPTVGQALSRRGAQFSPVARHGGDGGGQPRLGRSKAALPPAPSGRQPHLHWRAEL